MEIKTVTVNGCFDGLHNGHVLCLGFCRAQGDRLVVGINSDEYIRKKKGTVLCSEWMRNRAIVKLGVADMVCVFTEDNPIQFIKSILPDVHCIGEEYRDTAIELEICKQLGIKVVWIPRFGDWSSTAIRSGKSIV